MVLLAVVGGLLPSVATAAPRAGDLALDSPAAALVGELFAVTLDLPPAVAAVDGRILVAPDAAEVVGVAPLGPGNAFRPEEVTGGFSFGAFGLTPQANRSTVRIVIDPLRAGRLRLRVVVDTAADSNGTPMVLQGAQQLVTVRVGGGTADLAAPNAVGRAVAPRTAGRARDIVRNGSFDRQDLDIARGAWQLAQAAGKLCGPALEGDANGDGCVDIADVQALHALAGQATPSSALEPSSTSLAALAVRTFTVDSTADTPDATPGNAICADTLGRCTLRAALTEADWMKGEDRIEFNLAGPAPVQIQLASRLPFITARSGGVTIDGYTQPGSSPNTAASGSNAVPGVEIRGNGSAAREVGIYITSPGNTVRGVVLNNFYRGMFLDGVDAHDNMIIGNWIGFTRTGLNSSSGQYGIVLNTGSHDNTVGTPDPADRNVIGNWSAGIDNYGPGTQANVTQNNLFCIRPDGQTATCSTGIDHNFGPKNSLIGGTGPGEVNVFGPTRLQGIEFSHGWNPAGPPGADDPTYRITNNQVIGNWVGFRADGSYSASYRSGLNFSSADNDQAINIYDGTYDNLVEGNYLGTVYHGVELQSPNSSGNIVRNNIIGRSPLGEAAPMVGWGVLVRWSTTHNIIEGNTIENAAAGGVGLLSTNHTGAPQAPAYNIKITRNIITATNGPAIDLFGIAGPDPNDVGDTDTGANTVLNTPVITEATTIGIAGTGAAGATVEVYRASRPAGSYGLPTAYLGSALVAGNGAWQLPLASNLGDLVTALQIMPDSNTSELAANVAVGVPAATAPAITSANNTTFVTGTAGSFTVTTTGFPVPIIGQTGALPSGVTFTDNGDGTATLAGTPASGTAAAYPITITAANGVPPNATQNFTLTVREAPAITSADSTTFVAGSAGTFTVTTTGSPTPTLGATGTLPSGVTFTNNGNGTATLAGTPASGTAGTYPITITATNGVSPNATQGFTLTVDAPPPGAPLAEDPFNRTVSGGWGTAPTGGPWTVSSAGNFAVNGSAGTINLTAGATRYGRLAGVSAGSGDVLVKVTLNRLPVGGSAFAYIVGREVSTTTQYRMKVRIAADGRVFVQPVKAVNGTETNLGPETQVVGLTAAPGVSMSIRAQFAGSSPTTLRMRVWASSGAEPGTWATTVSDSQAELQGTGAVGLRAYLQGSVSNGPVLVSFDDYSFVP